MKMNTAKNVLKGVGGVLAVCSAVTMMAGTKSMSATSTKKTIKKTTTTSTLTKKQNTTKNNT